MSQYTRSFRTERPARKSTTRLSGDEPGSASRAWTITSDEEANFRPSPEYHPQCPPRTHDPSSHSQHTPSSQRSRTTNDSRNRDPPVRIHSPPPGGRHPSEAPSFGKWLQSAEGLTPREADRITRGLTYDEILHDERRSAYEASVAAQSIPRSDNRTVYSESVYSTNAPPSLPREANWYSPPHRSSAGSRTSKWVDDLREPMAGDPNGASPSSSRGRRDSHERSRR